MENFLFAVNAVVPLFLLVVAGCLVRRLHIMSSESIRQMNQVCFRVLLPCSMFISVAQADLRGSVDARLLIYLALAFISIVAISWIIVPRFVKSRPQAGSVIQACYRSNTVLFGVPLAQSLVGDEGAAQMAILLAMLIPLFNVMGILILSVFSEREDIDVSPKGILIEIVKNPLIIGIALGIAVSLSGLTLPNVLLKPISNIAGCGTPMAMMMLGAQLDFSSAMRHMKLCLCICAVKLVAVPLVFVTGGILMGFSHLALSIIFVVFANPVAVTSAIVADAMGCDGQLAGEAVLMTTLLSVITLFIGIMLLQAIHIL